MTDDGIDLAAEFKAMATGEPTETPEEEIESDSDESQPNTADVAEEQPETDSEEIDEAESEEAEGDEPEADEEEADSVEATEIELSDGTKVSLDELKNGYQRQSDYTRKTQELAAEKQKFFEQEIAPIKQQTLQVLEALNAKIQQYSPIPALERQLQDAISIGDTEEILRLRMDIRDIREEEARLQQAYHWEKQQADSKQKEQTQAEREANLAKQRETLVSKFPFLGDPKNAEGVKKFQQVVYNAAKELGWTDTEYKAIDSPDARDVAAYYYAGKYLDSIKASPQAAQKLKGKAVAPKTGARKPDSKSGTLDSAFRQFDKNPNAQGSLASIFKAL